MSTYARWFRRIEVPALIFISVGSLVALIGGAELPVLRALMSIFFAWKAFDIVGSRRQERSAAGDAEPIS